MSPDPTAEDLAAEAALAVLIENGLAEDGQATTPASNPGVDPRVRELTEVLGLLPVALGADEPPASLRERTLAAVRAEAARRAAERRAVERRAVERQAGERQAGAPGRAVDDLTLFGGGPRRESLDRTLVRPRGAPSIDLAPPPAEEAADILRPAERLLPEESGVRGLPAIGPSASSRERRGNGLPLALAAMLGLCLIGLAYLAGRLSSQEASLAALGTSLRDAQRQVAEMRARDEQLARVERHFRMITSVAQSAYPLRATADGRGSSGREPSGIVYVCGQHQQWYLSLKGLTPPAPGEHYVLWFITPDGAERGSLLEVSADGPAEAEATTMPDGTRGFAVTLESSSEPEEPAGHYVLLGDHAVSL